MHDYSKRALRSAQLFSVVLGQDDEGDFATANLQLRLTGGTEDVEGPLIDITVSTEIQEGVVPAVLREELVRNAKRVMDRLAGLTDDELLSAVQAFKDDPLDN